MTTPGEQSSTSKLSKIMNEDRPLAVMDNNYSAVHHWLKKHYGKADHCIIDPSHTSKRFEWANIDGIYEKDIEHFVQLCRVCHARMDIRESTRLRARTALKGVPNLNLSKRIGKYTLDGEFIEEYRSVAYAAEMHNTRPGNIVQHMKGQTKHARGFLWKYI